MHQTAEGDLATVQRVIVIPAFNETDSLPLLIGELALCLSDVDLIIIADDSAMSIARETERRCRALQTTTSCQLVFLSQTSKGGRGAAVRRGFDFALTFCPTAQWFLECDADGSHRADDIMNVLEYPSHPHLVVGSRYLPNSHIVGWSLGRRIQSRILNILIPLVLNLPLRDVTNGLRRYSRTATREIIEFPPTSSTFIYLTEQALIVQRRGLTIEEVPIRFEERRAGSSSVTWRELLASTKGLFQIIKVRSRFNSSMEV